jgi:hypothetical protein
MKIKSLRSKGGNPECPTGAGSSVNLWNGLNPRQGNTTSAGDGPASLNDPRAQRQRHQNLWTTLRGREVSAS